VFVICSMARTKQTPRKYNGSKAPRKVHATKAGNPRNAMERRRRRPGTVALREIRRYQKSTKLLIPRAAFEKLARETLTNLMDELDQYRLQPLAITALQEASEAHVVNVLHDSNLCCIHAVSYRYLVCNGLSVRLFMQYLTLSWPGRCCHITETCNADA
jgi:histone H3